MKCRSHLTVTVLYNVPLRNISTKIVKNSCIYSLQRFSELKIGSNGRYTLLPFVARPKLRAWTDLCKQSETIRSFHQLDHQSAVKLERKQKASKLPIQIQRNRIRISSALLMVTVKAKISAGWQRRRGSACGGTSEWGAAFPNLSDLLF